jgi:hypothetical protein
MSSFHQLILYALVCRTFLVTKLGNPAVKNGSPGRRTNVIFNRKTKTNNLYSQINHALQWNREVTYKNTTQHIHDK